MAETTTEPHKSTTSLLGDVMTHVSHLVRGEIDLAKAEAKRSATRAAAGIAMLVIGVVLSLVALNVLAAALVAAIAVWFTLSTGWASLIVGVVLLIVVAILVSVGIGRLKSAFQTPQRSVNSIKDDARVVKGALK